MAGCGSYRGDGADLVRGSAGRVPHERRAGMQLFIFQSAASARVRIQTAGERCHVRKTASGRGSDAGETSAAGGDYGACEKRPRAASCHGRQRKRSDDDGGITCRTDCSNTVKGHCLCGGYDRIHPSAGKGTGCAAGDRSGLRFQGGSPCDGAAAGCRCDPSGWNRE